MSEITKADISELGQSDIPRWNLDLIVSELRLSREVTHNIRHKGRIHRTPSRASLDEILGNLVAALFPTHFGGHELAVENIDYFVGNTLNNALVDLVEQVRRGLFFAQEGIINDEELSLAGTRIVRDFAEDLPAIRNLLVGDLRAAYRGDPAATNFPEILLGYPGMTAIIYYRLAHSLHDLGARVVARLISDIAHSKTGIDIHPAAQIGKSFFIDHGTGVVIGETTIIGDRVRIYQAVTLGARRFQFDDDGSIVKGEARHPIIEDGVVIYAGATILGRITIGQGSSIGGNVWLTKGVPPRTSVSQANVRSDRRSDKDERNYE